jgi:hypothetical protein
MEVSEPQVQDSAARPVHDERQEDDDEDDHHQPEEEHDDSGNCVPGYGSSSSHGLQLPGNTRIIRNCLWRVAGRIGGRFGQPVPLGLLERVAASEEGGRAALFTLLIVDLGRAATTVT